MGYGDRLASGSFVKASWGAINVSQSQWDNIWAVDKSAKPAKRRKARVREDKNARPQP